MHIPLFNHESWLVVKAEKIWSFLKVYFFMFKEGTPVEPKTQSIILLCSGLSALNESCNSLLGARLLVINDDKWFLVRH